MIHSTRKHRAAVVVAVIALGLATTSVTAQPNDPTDPVAAPIELGDDARPAPGSEYVLEGPRWQDRDLTWGIVAMTRDVSAASQLQALTAAFRAWDVASGLSFTRVQDCGLPFDDPRCTTPDIRVLFDTGVHSNSRLDLAFDGPGGSAGHAFYPPLPGGGTGAGDVHLDDGEVWRVDGRRIPDLQSLAMHEIGHALGLRHPPSSQCPFRPFPARATMCSTTYGADRTLAPDDIAGIRALYGPPSATETCAGRAVTVDLGQGEVPTSRADVIVGTNRPDDIRAGGGADVVCALGGDDTISLGPGADLAHGGGGGDRILGQGGTDRLYGQGGADRLDGGSHGDRLVGGPGIDTCHGRGGRDTASTCEQVTGVP